MSSADGVLSCDCRSRPRVPPVTPRPPCATRSNKAGMDSVEGMKVVDLKAALKGCAAHGANTHAQRARASTRASARTRARPCGPAPPRKFARTAMAWRDQPVARSRSLGLSTAGLKSVLVARYKEALSAPAQDDGVRRSPPPPLGALGPREAHQDTSTNITRETLEERLAREVRTRNACASARGWQSRVGAAAR